MSSILEQNPAATVGDVLRGIPEDLITRRERLRMLALMGGTSALALADLSVEDLAKALRLDAPSDEYQPDTAVVFGWTLIIKPNRASAIATLFLEYLKTGVLSTDKPAAQQAPTLIEQPTTPRFQQPKAAGKSPGRKPGVPVAPAQLLTQMVQREFGPQATGGRIKRTKPVGKGRAPVPSPAEVARRHRGSQN